MSNLNEAFLLTSVYIALGIFDEEKCLNAMLKIRNLFINNLNKIYQQARKTVSANDIQHVTVIVITKIHDFSMIFHHFSNNLIP